MRNWISAGLTRGTPPEGGLLTIATDDSIRGNGTAADPLAVAHPVDRIGQDFLGDLTGDGYATVTGATAQHLDDQPSLSNAEAFTYVDFYDVTFFFQNQYAGMRIPIREKMHLHLYALRVGPSGDNEDYRQQFNGESWAFVGDSGSYAYYTYQVADKPADDGLWVVKLSPLAIDTRKVSIDYNHLTNKPPDLFTEHIDGVLVGTSPTNLSADTLPSWQAIGAIDLDDAEYAHRVWDWATFTMSFVNPNPSTTLSFSPRSVQQTLTIDGGQTTSTAILATNAYSRTEHGVLIRSFPVYDGTPEVGRVEVRMAHDGGNRLAYGVRYKGGQQRGGRVFRLVDSGGTELLPDGRRGRGQHGRGADADSVRDLPVERFQCQLCRYGLDRAGQCGLDWLELRCGYWDEEHPGRGFSGDNGQHGRDGSDAADPAECSHAPGAGCKLYYFRPDGEQ